LKKHAKTRNPCGCRERERERESYSLKAIASLACVKGEISLPTGRLNIIYKAKNKDMRIMHRKTVC